MVGIGFGAGSNGLLEAACPAARALAARVKSRLANDATSDR